jgi:hypothetical protein
MKEPFQKITIGDHEYEFLHNPKDNSYSFIIDNNHFRFKRWTWGEKNRITNECVTFNPEIKQFEVNTVAFNEKMLARTLIGANIDGKDLDPTLDTIRDFNASLGDQLLLIAQWINSIEKEGIEGLGHKVTPLPVGENTYEIHLNGDTFKLGMWTWGEKNSVISQSIKFDAASSQMNIDLQAFNELLLLATIKEASVNEKAGQLDINVLRNLDAAVGDKLLQTAHEINNISETEKKTLKTH